jgi:Uma2 family endonuclease
MVIRERYISADEFWEIAHRPEYDDKMLELVEGEIREMSRPGGKHGQIVIKMSSPIYRFVEEHQLGHVTTETGYILFKNPNGKDTVRGPDLAFVALHRAPDGLPDGHVPFAPDLAVEVVSPNDSASDIDEKVGDYLRAGVRLIWVVYPSTKTVSVYTQTTIQRVPESGFLDGGDVLPGFQLRVSEIFPK